MYSWNTTDYGLQGRGKIRGLFPARATTYLLSKLDTPPTNILTSCYRKLLPRWQRVWGVDNLSASVLEVKNAGSPTSISPHASYFRSNYLISHGVYGVHVRVWETTLFHLCSIQFRHKKRSFESNSSSKVETTHIPHSPPFISWPPWPALRGLIKHGLRVSRLYLLHPAWLYHFQVNNALFKLGT